MDVPLQLTFRNVRSTPDLEAFVRRKVDKLEQFADHIVSCRIAIERPHEHATSGNPYRVRIDVRLPPGHELVVDERPGDHDLGEEIETVINAAFSAIERQIKELKDRQQGETKTHEEKRGLVVRLFPDDDYGFLKTPEGREIFFHRNSVAGDEFERLSQGTEVRFAETMGEDGPQATTVQIVGKPGERHDLGEEEELEPARGWGD